MYAKANATFAINYLPIILTGKFFNNFILILNCLNSPHAIFQHESVDNETDSQIQVPTEADMSKICRLFLWDGTSTVMYAAGETTIREALGILCERRGVGLSAVDVFYAGEDRPLSLDQDICVLGKILFI